MEIDIDMRGIKKEYRMAEWTGLIRQCVSSGMSVRDWCEANGINKRIYYYWQDKVRKTMIETSLALSRKDGAFLPGVVNDTPELVRIEAPPVASPPPHMPVMHIRIGASECAVYDGADPELVERALAALGARVC
jgi:putative transposase